MSSERGRSWSRSTRLESRKKGQYKLGKREPPCLGAPNRSPGVGVAPPRNTCKGLALQLSALSFSRLVGHSYVLKTCNKHLFASAGQLPLPIREQESPSGRRRSRKPRPPWAGAVASRGAPGPPVGPGPGLGPRGGKASARPWSREAGPPTPAPGPRGRVRATSPAPPPARSFPALGSPLQDVTVTPRNGADMGCWNRLALSRSSSWLNVHYFASGMLSTFITF